MRYTIIVPFSLRTFQQHINYSNYNFIYLNRNKNIKPYIANLFNLNVKNITSYSDNNNNNNNNNNNVLRINQELYAFTIILVIIIIIIMTTTIIVVKLIT